MDGVWTMRAHRLSQVRSRVDRFLATRAPEVVLTSDALGEVVDLLCSVPDPVEDVEVAQAAGWLFWLRFAARGTVDGEAELMVALDLLAPLYLSGGGAGVPDLIGELFDDKPPAEPDGVVVLAKLGRAQYRETLENADEVALSRSVDLLRRAVAVAGSDHPDYARCLTNLGSALLTRFERAELPADLEEAIELSRAAVAATRPDEPARATYLSNLGNALLTGSSTWRARPTSTPPSRPVRLRSPAGPTTPTTPRWCPTLTSRCGPGPRSATRRPGWTG